MCPNAGPEKLSEGYGRPDSGPFTRREATSTYALFVNELQTSVLTFVSHGSKGEQIKRGILGAMAEETKLDFADFLRLIDGNMDHEEYVRILKEKEILK